MADPVFKYTLVSGPVELKGPKSVVLLLSRQTMTVDGANEQDLLVIKKIRRAVDGAQYGSAQQIQFPFEMKDNLATIISESSFDKEEDLGLDD